MPRIIGVDIPGNKKVEFALRYLYGIGPAIAKQIVTKLNIDPDLRAKDLTDEHIAAITVMLQN